MNEMAGVILLCGPPFKAMNRWPSSSQKVRHDRDVHPARCA